MLETLKFQKLDRRAKLTQAHDGDAGYDLSCLDGFKLDGGERATIGTGLAVELPEGYAAFVMSRSGLASKYGVFIPNGPGVVDSGYGERSRSSSTIPPSPRSGSNRATVSPNSSSKRSKPHKSCSSPQSATTRTATPTASEARG